MSSKPRNENIRESLIFNLNSNKAEEAASRRIGRGQRSILPFGGIGEITAGEILSVLLLATIRWTYTHDQNVVLKACGKVITSGRLKLVPQAGRFLRALRRARATTTCYEIKGRELRPTDVYSL